VRALRFNADLEIVGFHRTGEVKTLYFLYRERKSLNLGSTNYCVCLCVAKIFTSVKNLIVLIFGYIAGSFFRKMHLYCCGHANGSGELTVENEYKMIETQTNTLWLKAGIIGSTWAAFEIIVGSFLHNLQVPFAGTLLSAASVFLLISFLQMWQEKGIILRAGIICALMKSISPSAIIIGPMVGIFMEAVIIELFVLVLGRNVFGYIVSGAVAVLWSLGQKILFLLLMYGLDLIELAKSLYQYLIKISGIDGLSAFYLIVGIVFIYLIVGSLAAYAGFVSGKRYLKAPVKRSEPITANHNYSQVLNAHTDQPFSLVLLGIIVSMIVVSLYFINNQMYVYGAISAVSFVVFCIARYKNAMGHLRKPGIWIQFFLITTGAAVLWDWTSTGNLLSLNGLTVGLEMNARAIIIIFGFAAVGVELRNPIITALLYKRGFKNLHHTLTFAFSALPAIIDSLPKPTHILKERKLVIAQLLNQSQNLYHTIEKQNT
jgi:hypothetical protein